MMMIIITIIIYTHLLKPYPIKKKPQHNQQRRPSEAAKR